MKILITGSTGVIGSAVVNDLKNQGHTVAGLYRMRHGTEPFWDIEKGIIDLGSFGSPDVVIHLAGEPILGRWTRSKKARIYDSRVDGTRLLAQSIARLDPKPSCFMSGSAIGFYGAYSGQRLTEKSSVGSGFLANLCAEWEDATAPAIAAGIRTIHLRTGIVLTPSGGVLKSMLLPFKLGLGGRLGSGNQVMSWISLTDMVNIIRLLIDHDSLSGPINLTAPNSVTNKGFTAILSRFLNRPALFNQPSWILRILFGELANEVILSSSEVYPDKLMKAGYLFSHLDLESALKDLLSKKSKSVNK